MRERHSCDAAEDLDETLRQEDVAVTEEVAQEEVDRRDGTNGGAEKRVVRGGDAVVRVRHVVQTGDEADAESATGAAQEERRAERQAPVVDDVGDAVLDEGVAQGCLARLREDADIRYDTDDFR